MSKIGFIFPGQGSQYIGMGKEIYENFASAKSVFDEASKVLDFDTKQMIFEGSEEDLNKTENTQPAILITSIACYEALKERGIKPDMVAGLSLGEYSAHVASGSMKFADAVRLLKKRGRFMQEAVPAGVGLMAAILGLDKTNVEKACKEATDTGIVEPANFNCPGQIVIAGEIAAVEKAIELAKEKGAKRAIPIAMSVPSHCSLMKNAGERLSNELKLLEVNEMSIPVVANVDAGIISDKFKIKDLLIRQVSSSVHWEDCVRNMLDNGVTTFIEVGPGKVLSGFVKKIDKEVKVLNVEDMGSLEKTLNAIK